MPPQLGAALGLALIDSLNPATISEAGLLASARRPIPTVLAYWSGALLTYLGFGLLIVLGLGPFLAEVLRDPPDLLRAAEVVAGLAALAGGVVLWRRRHSLSFATKLADGDARFAFRFGVLVTLGDLPTAAPYLAAVGILVASGLSALEQLGALLLYNLVYLAPVLGVLALRLILGRRAEAPLRAVRRFVERWAGPALAVLLVAGGAALCLDGSLALAR